MNYFFAFDRLTVCLKIEQILLELIDLQIERRYIWTSLMRKFLSAFQKRWKTR